MNKADLLNCLEWCRVTDVQPDVLMLSIARIDISVSLCSLGLHFVREYGGSKFFRNVGELSDYTATHYPYTSESVGWTWPCLQVAWYVQEVHEIFAEDGQSCSRTRCWSFKKTISLQHPCASWGRTPSCSWNNVILRPHSSVGLPC
jgi:hypothetical protein